MLLIIVLYIYTHTHRDQRKYKKSEERNRVRRISRWCRLSKSRWCSVSSWVSSSAEDRIGKWSLMDNIILFLFVAGLHMATHAPGWILSIAIACYSARSKSWKAGTPYIGGNTRETPANFLDLLQGDSRGEPLGTHLEVEFRPKSCGCFAVGLNLGALTLPKNNLCNHSLTGRSNWFKVHVFLTTNEDLFVQPFFHDKASILCCWQL